MLLERVGSSFPRLPHFVRVEPRLLVRGFRSSPSSGLLALIPDYRGYDFSSDISYVPVVVISHVHYERLLSAVLHSRSGLSSWRPRDYVRSRLADCFFLYFVLDLL